MMKKLHVSGTRNVLRLAEDFIHKIEAQKKAREGIQFKYTF